MTKVAAYLSEWTTERLRALHEAQALAKVEYNNREKKRMERNNARQSLMFLGDITKTGMKNQYAGPELNQLQSGGADAEENLVVAILALKKSKMGNKLNFMELARMLRPKVGDAWSDRVWEAMRSHVADEEKEGPADDDDDDDDDGEGDDEDEDLIGEALHELGKYLGGALNQASLRALKDPEDDNDDDATSDHGDELEEQRKIHAKVQALPDNVNAQKWRTWVQRRAARKKELLPVGYIGWIDPDAVVVEEEEVMVAISPCFTSRVAAAEDSSKEEEEEETVKTDGQVRT